MQIYRAIRYSTRRIKNLLKNYEYRKKKACYMNKREKTQLKKIVWLTIGYTVVIIAIIFW